MAKTLSHELAHVLLHTSALQAGTLERARAEVEAESTAYLVCAGFGLNSMEYTLGYVATWSGGDSTQVLATAATVQRCARAILEAADSATQAPVPTEPESSFPGEVLP
jgi:antirestriction protein ArdC